MYRTLFNSSIFAKAALQNGHSHLVTSSGLWLVCTIRTAHNSNSTVSTARSLYCTLKTLPESLFRSHSTRLAASTFEVCYTAVAVTSARCRPVTGAGGKTRTFGLFLTKELRYHLRHTSDVIPTGDKLSPT